MFSRIFLASGFEQLFVLQFWLQLPRELNLYKRTWPLPARILLSARFRRNTLPGQHIFSCNGSLLELHLHFLPI